MLLFTSEFVEEVTEVLKKVHGSNATEIKIINGTPTGGTLRKVEKTKLMTSI